MRDVLRRAGAEAPLVQVHRTIQDAVDAVSGGEAQPAGLTRRRGAEASTSLFGA